MHCSQFATKSSVLVPVLVGLTVTLAWGAAETSVQNSACSGPANMNCNSCIGYEFDDNNCIGANNNGKRCGSIKCSTNDSNTFKACLSVTSSSNYCTSGGTFHCNSDLTCKSFGGACETKNFNGTSPGCVQPTCPGTGGTTTTTNIQVFSPCT